MLLHNAVSRTEPEMHDSVTHLEMWAWTFSNEIFQLVSFFKYFSD